MEYNTVREIILEEANKHFNEHKRAFENWREGNIDRVWIDKDGYLCIQYDSGEWWHYNDKGEWW